MPNNILDNHTVAPTLPVSASFEAYVTAYELVLREGNELQRQLNQQKFRCLPTLKELARSRFNLSLFADEVVDRRAPPIVTEALRIPAKLISDSGSS